ncbi:hypothetical protein LX73_1709 [Fodinibius salinus]|uniref:Uncharacterized protein n=2 Tax=Fodinibius salinus TaxID=860790 RepID=A0A5D3YMR9_9BACT|nr:hypothetical protein LX73_1709 [Fodinibius salinus]
MFRGVKEIIIGKVNYTTLQFEVDQPKFFLETIINKKETNSIILLLLVHCDESVPPLSKQESKEINYYTEVPLLVLSGASSSIMKKS